MNKLTIRTKDNPNNPMILETNISKIELLKKLNNQNIFIDIEGIYINKNNISFITLKEEKKVTFTIDSNKIGEIVLNENNNGGLNDKTKM